MVHDESYPRTQKQLPRLLCILPFSTTRWVMLHSVYFCCPRQQVRILGMLEGVINIVLRLLQGQRNESAITWYYSDLQERNIEMKEIEVTVAW